MTTAEQSKALEFAALCVKRATRWGWSSQEHRREAYRYLMSEVGEYKNELTHFLFNERHITTSCGRKYVEQTTTDHRKTTCRGCKRTSAFKRITQEIDHG